MTETYHVNISLDDITPAEWTSAARRESPPTQFDISDLLSEALGTSDKLGSSAPDSYQVGGDHYSTMSLPPWDVMEMLLTPEEFKGFLKGNIIKYALRQDRKPGSDDRAKALHYGAKLKSVSNV